MLRVNIVHTNKTNNDTNNFFFFFTYIIIHILFHRWWRGQSGCTAGWFPSNYTHEEDDADGDDGIHTYAMAENVLDIVVALYSFTSTNEQELSFEKGDR